MTWIARTVPFTSGFHATSVPLATLNAATWLRVTSCEPAGAPGGRTAVNWPPMYTRFLYATITLTRPFVCHVGVGVVDTTANAGVPITSPHAPNTTAIAAARNTRALISPPDGRFESPVQGTAGTGQVKTVRIRAHRAPRPGPAVGRSTAAGAWNLLSARPFHSGARHRYYRAGRHRESARRALHELRVTCSHGRRLKGEYCYRHPVTTGREEVGSEASTRVRRAVAAAMAAGAFLLGAGVALVGAGAAIGDS